MKMQQMHQMMHGRGSSGPGSDGMKMMMKDRGMM
jgi:hypothetical protein